MNEAPIDLQRLDPGEPPDLVKRAMRRFRWHVVLGTVVAILVTTGLAGWGIVSFMEGRDTALLRQLPPAQQAVFDDHVGNCKTPTYGVEEMEVGLLQAAPMPGGGRALHFVVHGDRPLTDQRASYRFWTLGPVGDGADPVQILTQPGATWGEAYVEVPASLGTRFQVQFRDTHLDVVGTFTVDIEQMACP